MISFGAHIKRSARNGMLSFASVGALLLLFPSFAFGATLSLDPDQGTFGPGDMFMVTIRLDTTPEECVNVAMIELLYPNDWMKATVISKGESLLSLWAEDPAIDHEHGLIRFSGGIPGGYCGRVQGDPGKTNVLAKVVFNIPGNMVGGKVATGPVPLALSFGTSTTVLLNDGFGTPAPLTVHEATLERSLTSAALKNEWLDIVHGDDAPPDQFIATVEHDPNVFGGKYFLAFSTVDKQSGINHYEVREDDPERLDFMRGKNTKAEFVPAPSLYYYELADQDLKSRITVRAYDNARNYTDWIIAPLRGPHSRTDAIGTSTSLSSRPWFLFGLLPVLLAIVVGSVMYFWKRKEDSPVSTSEHHDDTSHQ